MSTDGYVSAQVSTMSAVTLNSSLTVLNRLVGKVITAGGELGGSAGELRARGFDFSGSWLLVTGSWLLVMGFFSLSSETDWVFLGFSEFPSGFFLGRPPFFPLTEFVRLFPWYRSISSWILDWI